VRLRPDDSRSGGNGASSYDAREGKEKAVSAVAERAVLARNPKLETLERMIIDGSCAVLSLDIFDTILWRRVPRPTDVFPIVGHRLKRAGLCPEWVPDASFRRMRIAAEQNARRRRGTLGPEVSLFDIWREMPLGLFQGATLDELVDAEVRTERDFTVIDLDVAEIVTLAQKHGVPVIFVSDTYFTEEHLNHLLARPQLGDLTGVRIFRSHQHGLDKASGLFDIVLEQLGCRPEQVVHIGDNLVADIETPGELGVRTVFYERVSEAFAEVLERERESMDSFGPYGALVDPEEGDFGLTSLRAKTLQSAPSGGASGTRTAWRYGAGVLGPVLTGFAEWVAERAQQSGRSVVWCPMREGTVLSALVNNAADARGWDVEARPLWLSRHVASLAALDPLDPEALHEFVGRSYRMTVRQLLSTLGLRSGEVPALAQVLNTVLDNHGIVTSVRDALLETPHLRNRLAVTVTEARERLLRELRSTGALDGAELTLVDLGWGGTIQYYLARALELAGVDVRPAGYYLATDERSTRVSLAGLQMEGYLGEAGHPHDVVHTLVRSPEVIEQSVNDLCGSLLGFAADGAPVLGPCSDSQTQNEERSAVHEGIFAFQRQWNRYAEGGSWPSLTGRASKRLAAILVEALRTPTAEEAILFGSWGHEDNLGSTVVTHMVPDDLVSAVPYMSPLDLADLGMRDAFWPALIAASDVRLGAAVRALEGGHVEAGVFETTDQSETTLAVQTSDGEWHDSGNRRVRINHDGLSFARFHFGAWHGDVVALLLSLPGRPAIVRLDWVELNGIRAGHTESEVLRWEEPDDFAGKSLKDAAWLGGRMFEFNSAVAAIQLSLIERSRAPFSSGQVTVAFAMLPKSTTGLGGRLPAASRRERISNRVRDEYKTRGPAGIASAAARAAARKLRSAE
jgi:FMN phosphatase YigB (HAD superfamily)